jgi:hypothetical protein
LVIASLGVCGCVCKLRDMGDDEGSRTTAERARFALSQVSASIGDHGREQGSTSCKASALTN